MCDLCCWGTHYRIAWDHGPFTKHHAQGNLTLELTAMLVSPSTDQQTPGQRENSDHRLVHAYHPTNLHRQNFTLVFGVGN